MISTLAQVHPHSTEAVYENCTATAARVANVAVTVRFPLFMLFFKTKNMLFFFGLFDWNFPHVFLVLVGLELPHKNKTKKGDEAGVAYVFATEGLPKPSDPLPRLVCEAVGGWDWWFGDLEAWDSCGEIGGKPPQNTWGKKTKTI